MENNSFSNYSLTTKGITNIKFSKETGNDTLRVVAGKEFKEGDIILDEEPTLCAQYYHNKICFPACSHCLRSTESPCGMVRRLTRGRINQHLNCTDYITGLQVVFCDRCSDMYCCEECKKVAWETYHRFLCFGERPKIAEHLQHMEDLWKQFHNPPEYINIPLLLRVLSSITHLIYKQVLKEDALGIWEEFFLEEDADFFELQFNGLDIIEKTYNICLDIFGDPNIQKVRTSAFQGYVHYLTNNDSKKSDDFWEEVNDIEEAIQEMSPISTCEGSGLYLVSGRLRHSCRPNCSVVYSPNSFAIRITAAKNIAPGEALTRNCLGVASDTSLNVKRSLLCNRYVANCQCKKCTKLIPTACKSNTRGWFSGIVSFAKGLIAP